MYLTVQSCIHVVNNFLWPPEPDQNMVHLSPYYRPMLNSAKFHKNVEIPHKWANFVARLKPPKMACGKENLRHFSLNISTSLKQKEGTQSECSTAITLHESRLVYANLQYKKVQ